jgi:hypothetical protein
VEHRELGLEAGLECFYRGYVDELWLFGDYISEGMNQEINLAKKMNIPVIPKTKAIKKLIEE